MKKQKRKREIDIEERILNLLVFQSEGELQDLYQVLLIAINLIAVKRWVEKKAGLN